MPDFKLLPLEFPVGSVRRVFVLEVDGVAPFANFAKEMKKAGKKLDLGKLAFKAHYQNSEEE